MNFKDVSPDRLLENTKSLFVANYGHKPTLVEVVFWRQESLMKLYKPIEERILGEPLPGWPLPLHDAKSQNWMKQRAWWVTEELMEAQWGMWESNLDKTVEELADALHFMTELCILGGVEVEFQENPPRKWHSISAPFNTAYTFRNAISPILEELGIGMWQFRNKAWKQTQTLTDIAAFQNCMRRAWWGIFKLMSLPPFNGYVDATTTYLRKSEVNLWRIKTQY